MDLSKTLVLGFIAGATIVLGLPIGRLRRPAPGLRVVLNGVAVGILLFLMFDVLEHAWSPIDGALSNLHGGTGGFSPVLGYGALFIGGLAVGMLALVGYDRYLHHAVRSPQRSGPGAMAVDEVPTRGVSSWSPARRLVARVAQ